MLHFYDLLAIYYDLLAIYNVPVDLDRNLQKEREPDTVKQAKERQ